ncbi:MAG: hypothetical protein AB1801_17965 [Chloroflexota bacterium]
MVSVTSIGLRAVFSLFLIIALLYLPSPAYSQDGPQLQNLILNGDFEEGFQEEFGVGYGWGAFSNGNALVGWNSDTWEQVVAAGDSAQMIEIKNAADMNRYAGIYQTVSVVPGEQYRLIIKGLVRSTEGDIKISDYGYRLQYAVDQRGSTAWELLPAESWIEIPWDEQPLNDPPSGVYRLDTFETTVTAQSEQLTLFIRGWKKWVNNGSGIFDLDEISLTGPAPENFEVPSAQAAVVNNPAVLNDTQLDTSAAPVQVEEQAEVVEEQPQAKIAPQTQETAPVQAMPQAENTQLPVSGQSQPDILNYIVFSGAALLLVLLVGAAAAMLRQRQPLE